jgi:hypothetical protein
MSDQFTEVSTKSWGSRLLESLKGIIFGFILIIVSIILLWWNEGRAIHTENDLKDGSKNVVHLQSNIPVPENENKLVHLTGEISTTDTLKDPDFNISVKAVALRRNVFIYQWVENEEEETEKQLGGSEKITKKYTYTKEWVSNQINSDDFKNKYGHLNKSAYDFQNNSLKAKQVFVDSFKLSTDLINSAVKYEPYELDSNIINKSYKVSSDTIYLGSGNLGNNPVIGDMKISFDVVYPSKTVSIVSKQSNNTLVPFIGKNGSTISELVFGTVSANEMFKNAISRNSTLTWVLRLVGLICCIFGFMLILNPLVIIGDVVPFIGSILGIGTGLVSSIFGFIVSFITIAIAWLFYRPIISIILIAVSVLFFIFLLSKRKPIKN